MWVCFRYLGTICDWLWFLYGLFIEIQFTLNSGLSNLQNHHSVGIQLPIWWSCYRISMTSVWSILVNVDTATTISLLVYNFAYKQVFASSALCCWQRVVLFLCRRPDFRCFSREWQGHHSVMDLFLGHHENKYDVGRYRVFIRRQILKIIHNWTLSCHF